MGSLARLGMCGFVLVKSYQRVVGNLLCFCLSAVRDSAQPAGGNSPHCSVASQHLYILL